MAMYYLSSIDEIKNRLFDVSIPGDYNPHIPKDILYPIIEPKPKINTFRMTPVHRRPNIPVVVLGDSTATQKASLSIETLVEMYSKKIDFMLYNEEDIIRIFDAIDRYFLVMRDDVELGNEDVINYLKIMLRFREIVYKLYFRYMKTNQGALERIYPNHDSKRNILSMMASLSLSGTPGSNVDPLVARANPPYSIDNIKPRTDTERELENSIECSLGIPTGGFTADDGKDFDFDNFLNR